MTFLDEWEWGTKYLLLINNIKSLDLVGTKKNSLAPEIEPLRDGKLFSIWDAIGFKQVLEKSSLNSLFANKVHFHYSSIALEKEKGDDKGYFRK